MERLGHLPGSRTRTSAGRVAFSALTNISAECARCGVEVDDLAERVHAGVGSAAGVGRRLGRRQLADRFLQNLLHGAPVGLALPAGEVGAVVAQDELDVAHRPGSYRRPVYSVGHELEQLLGDLDGVGRGPLAEVVGDAPEQQGVGPVQVLADPADEDVVLAGRRRRQGILLSRGGVVDDVSPGARTRSRGPASGVIGRSVSTRIDSLWLFSDRDADAGRADVDRCRRP